MKRVEEDGMWSLMCPHICPGLSDCWGEKFEELYTRYETEGKFMKQVRLLIDMVTFEPLYHKLDTLFLSITSYTHLKFTFVKPL